MHVIRHRYILFYKTINFQLDDEAEPAPTLIKTASGRLDLSFASNKIIQIEICISMNEMTRWNLPSARILSHESFISFSLFSTRLTISATKQED